MMQPSSCFRAMAAVAVMLAGQSCTVKQNDTPDLTGPSTVSTPIGPAPPVARFTFAPDKPQASIQVAFDGRSSCPEGGFTGGCIATDRSITTFTWDFGDGSADSGPNVSHTFKSTGSFNVTLTVQNDRGLASSTARSVQVDPGTPPKAEFVFSPNTPAIGQSVSFNASQSTPGPGHNIASYAWDFGDGGKASGVNPSHSFGSAGGYSVVLTVTDDVGQSAAATKQVAVGAAPSTPAPTADFVFSPAAPASGQSVSFNASQSKAASGHSIVSLSWNFGDGGTDSGMTPSHTFGAAGTYSVVLVVTDDVGQTGTVSKQVPVSSSSATPPPTAVFTFSPSQPALGDTVSFNASNSTASSGRSIVSYRWTFGDNSAPVTTSTPTTTHIYSASSGAGSFTVTLIATDNGTPPGTGTATQVVPVGNPPAPSAKFTFSPSPAAVAQPVFFDATISTAAQGQTITDYAWVFGDNTTIVHTANKTISHSYAAAGTYSVTLTVTDSAGRTNSSSPQPVPVGGATANFTVLPASPTAGATVTFNGSASSPSPGAGSIVSWVWSFSDGGSTTGVTTTHVYGSPGSYDVTLTVTDDKGQSGTLKKTVVVN